MQRVCTAQRERHIQIRSVECCFEADGPCHQAHQDVQRMPSAWNARLFEGRWVNGARHAFAATVDSIACVLTRMSRGNADQAAPRRSTHISWRNQPFGPRTSERARYPSLQHT